MPAPHFVLLVFRANFKTWIDFGIILYADAFQREYDSHLEKAGMERKKYYKHNSKAKLCHKYLSIIIDGMTQNTTRMPHHAQKPSHWEKKKENTTPFYETHLMGILAFDVTGTAAFCELSHANVSNNADLTIDTIHRTILRNQEARHSQGIPAPEVLYLQLDNVNSNKSKRLLWYCAWLVMTDVFKKVKVGFLLVGHTHENIDQLFSRISLRLKRANCHTLSDLKALIEKSFKPTPGTAHITHVNDWKAFFTRGNVNDVHDISFNHQFKIKANDSGTVMVSSKQYSTDANWGTPSPVLLEPPTGIPCALPDKKLEPLKMTALKFVRDIYAKYQKFDWDNEDVKTFWDTEIDYQERIVSGHPPDPPHNLYQPLHSLTEAPVVPRIALEPNELARYQPDRRDIYVGRQRTAAEREAAEYLQDQYMRVSFRDMNPGSVALVKASTGHHASIAPPDHSFRLKLGQNSLSEPLLLAKVVLQYPEAESLSWQYYKPIRFTNVAERYIANTKATTSGCFRLPPAPTDPTAVFRARFSSDDVILSWDLDEGDDETCLEAQQHQEAMIILRSLRQQAP